MKDQQPLVEKWRRRVEWNPLHVVGQEMLLLKHFNKRFTLRRLPNYGDPIINQLKDLRLPRGSILHYFSLRNESIGPVNTLSYLQDLEKNARVRHHANLTTEGIIGRPIKVPVQGQDREILNYHRNNRNLRRFTDVETIENEPKILLIENYTPIIPHHRYADTLLSWYERLRNYLTTIVAQIKEDAEKFQRQNYFMVDLGNSLPAYATFVKAMTGVTNEKLKPFNDGTLTPLILIELFGFLSGKRTDTYFNDFDPIVLRRVNFIFTHNTGFFNLNLGELLIWSKVNGGALNDEQMGRRFYASLVKLMTTPPEISTMSVSPDGTVSLNEEDVEADVEIDEKDFQEEIERFENLQKETFDEEQDVVLEEKKTDEKPTTIVIENNIKHEDVILREVEALAEQGAITAKRYNVIKESAVNFKKMKNPYDPSSKQTYEEAMTVTAEDIKVEPIKLLESETVLDKSWTVNFTDAAAKKYNQQILQKDILQAVASAQRLGIILHDHQVEKVVSASGNYEVHKLKLQPFGGEPNTVHFQIPTLDSDGYWTANNVKYTMRPQKVDKPIRKVAPDTVSMTTGYGKNFVTRSERVVNDRTTWVGNVLVEEGIGDGKLITDIIIANSFDPLVKLPREYTTVSKRVSGFKCKGYEWNFDCHKVEKFFGADVVSKLEKDKLIPVAKSNKAIIAMDMKSQLYKIEGEKVEAQDELLDFIGIDRSKEPFEVTCLGLMGKDISLGFIFSYYLGLRGMLEHFNIRFEIVAAGTRTTQTEADAVIRLADSKYLLYIDNDEQRFIVNGLKSYLKHMVRYSEGELNNKDVYLNLLMEDGLNAKYLKELDRMRDGFVDDMHARKLIEMGEPTTFIGLLRRANEMLTDDYSRPEINSDDMMILGNQRIAHHLYSALVKMHRNYENQSGSNKKLELTNSMVWGSIAEDPSILIVQEAGPIQSIKEKDVVTVGGTGGRKRITMVERTREFHREDLGIMSGDTVDNQDAGATTFRSANPIMQNIDGFSAPRKVEELEMGNLFSFVVGMSPGSTRDEDKRRNFIGIQYGSTQAAYGYISTPYRTGVEQLVAHRTSSKHARIAEQECKVIEKDESSITVKYKDGTIESIPLGLWFGAHEGATYQHENVANWKVGDTIREREVISYNKYHFEPDLFNKGQVNHKNGIPAIMCLIEGEPVFEDSSAIYSELAKKMSAPKTTVKAVTIKSTEELLTHVKLGQTLGVDDILCSFTDAVYEDDGDLSDAALQSLMRLDTHSPKAGSKGTINNIEVYYHGEIEDMRPKLAAFVKEADRRRAKAAKNSKDPKATTGRVDGSFRVDGIPLAYGSVAVFFYITTDADMSGGDKGVIANQMKTTIQYVYTQRAYTDSNVTIQGYFGREGVEARIVGSIHEIGTTLRLSYHLGSIAKETALS